MSDNPVQPTTEEQQPQTTSGKVEFTPEQQRVFDYELAQRARRAEESATRKALEKLGVENLESAAEALKKVREREEAEMTEREKLHKQIDDLANKNKAHTEQIQFMQRQRLTDARDTAIKSALTNARVTNTDRVFTLLSAERKAELEAVMSETGEIDKKSVEKLIASAQKEYPEYFRSGSPGSPSNAGGTAPSADAERIRKTLEQRKPIRL